MTDPKTVKFLSLRDEVPLPRRGSLKAAGFDLCCLENLTIHKNETVTIPLGFATEMPDDIYARIESRSGLAIKGVVVQTGVIDADYRGEWKVIMRYTPTGPQESYAFAKGERVAQVCFRRLVPVSFDVVSELSDSSRGTGGFGSTGG
jgi:dUTP pyrophosphatase